MKRGCLTCDGGLLSRGQEGDGKQLGRDTVTNCGRKQLVCSRDVCNRLVCMWAKMVDSCRQDEDCGVDEEGQREGDVGVPGTVLDSHFLACNGPWVMLVAALAINLHTRLGSYSPDLLGCGGMRAFGPHWSGGIGCEA